MARGVNKVILVGNLGNDPEVRYAQSGTCMTSISIATSESWKDKTSGEQVERTEWHRVKFFGRLAEIAGEYLKKGAQVYIEGKLRTDKYTDKNDIERYTTDVIAEEMQMLGGKPGNNDAGPRQNAPSRGASRQAPGNRPTGDRGQYGSSRSGLATPAGDMPPSRNDDPFPEDDIPF